MAGWTATLRPNPSDPHPVTFAWDDGELISSDDGMLEAVEHLASSLPHVAATPTGPFLPPDLSIGHVAFSVVLQLAELAGVPADAVEVEGEGWRWPTMKPVADAVY